MRRHFSAGGVLLNSANQIYLIHELERDEWALPKGTIEDGESILDAAVREISEETGYKEIEVVTTEPFFVNNYETIHHGTGESLDKTVYLFIFKTTSQKQLQTKEMEKEGLEGNWFTFEGALERITHPEQKQAVKKALDILENIIS